MQPPAGFDGKAFTGDGPAINSANDEVSLDGLDVADAKRAIIDWLEAQGAGEATVTYRLRDWLFSRQRYWGEPFPIVYDEHGLPIAVPESMLPVELPDTRRLRARAVEPTTPTRCRSRRCPAPTTGSTSRWTSATARSEYRRETNTMPQWAGSCWYELRYLDPTNDDAFVDPDGRALLDGHRPTATARVGVDLYVGGVEHAVLHLLYARFWHKVLFDLGYVSTLGAVPPPVQPGLHPGLRLHRRPRLLRAGGGRRRARRRLLPRRRAGCREYGKIGKSLKNVVTPGRHDATSTAPTRCACTRCSAARWTQSRPWDTQRRRRRLPVPAAAVARRASTRDRRAARRRARPSTTTPPRAAPDDRRGARRHTTRCGSTPSIARLIELNNHV